MSREDNQCGGKVKYQTYEDAHAAAANLNKRGKRKMGTYKCSECNLYHVGHNQRANQRHLKTWITKSMITKVKSTQQINVLLKINKWL